MPANDRNPPEPSDQTSPGSRDSRTPLPQEEVAAPPSACATAPPSPRPKDGGTRSAATQGGSNPAAFHSALLLGADHTQLEEVTIREVTSKVAVGISRGRFPKGYPHVDPNEDAVYAATDGSVTILAIADGHHGFDAARSAIQQIADTALDNTRMPPPDLARHLAEVAVAVVADTIPDLASPRDTSRASLTICVIDRTTIAATTIGDTACYITTKRRVKRLGKDTSFLGPNTDPRSVTVTSAPVPPVATIIVASDGLLDFAQDLTAALRSTHARTAADSTELLINEAFAGGAGDNVSIAVCRPP